jgi:hypothetical protein
VLFYINIEYKEKHAMKKITLLFVILGMLSAQDIFTQTSGTLTFTMNTSATGGYSPYHLLAIWIESNSGTFIKTKRENCSTKNLNHLGIWVSKSAQNVVDAITGATLTEHGTVTINWNGTNTSGVLVPDGDYLVWVEMAWDEGLITGKTTSSFAFTKGPANVHLTPADQTHFTGIVLDWALPNPASVKENQNSTDVTIYPNPTSDKISIALKNNTSACKIQIMNLEGSKIYEENIEYPNGETRTVDLSRFADGIYFVNVQSRQNLSITRVVKRK